ncbi:MAG: sugar transferase [bacterium]|nr:sugar transferase [bacterium]
MNHKKEPIILFIGDILVLFLSLWLTLLIRFRDPLNFKLFVDHLTPFAILFAISILIFFIAGLYEKHTVLYKGKLPQIILNSQITNAVVAISLFYFFPHFIVAPKVTLFIYLVISSLLISWWRMKGVSRFETKKKEISIVIGRGPEIDEMVKEINNNSRYGIFIDEVIDPDTLPSHYDIKQMLESAKVNNISLFIIDTANEKTKVFLEAFYRMIFSGVRFVDSRELYEEVFGRVPLSLVDYDWFLSNISLYPKPIYSLVKRIMDILISGILGLISLIFYPFVYLVIKIEDKGPLFIFQDRIGKGGKRIRIVKFRSMSRNDNAEDYDNKVVENKVTKVGSFLRKTRIDELPQLWNVFKGDLSLIGPRPELPKPVELYEKEISYYNVRHLITPGLSGFAQIYHENPSHHSFEINEAKNKLSYDLFYIKNRSLILDLKITLRTIKILLTFVGR